MMFSKVIFSYIGCHRPFDGDFPEDCFGRETDAGGPFVDLPDLEVCDAGDPAVRQKRFRDNSFDFT